VRILFDQGTPVPLRDSLKHHEVSTTHERGWSRLANGELLDASEREGFALLVTTDSNLRYQQNLGARSLAIVVLLSTSWPRIRRAISRVVGAIDAATPGTYAEVEIP
jgi:hypothetical protein